MTQGLTALKKDRGFVIYIHIQWLTSTCNSCFTSSNSLWSLNTLHTHMHTFYTHICTDMYKILKCIFKTQTPNPLSASGREMVQQIKNQSLNPSITYKLCIAAGMCYLRDLFGSRLILQACWLAILAKPEPPRFTEGPVSNKEVESHRRRCQTFGIQMSMHTGTLVQTHTHTIFRNPFSHCLCCKYRAGELV